MRQVEFKKTQWRHRLSYGGTLRQKRNGRGSRPLSKEPLHLVLKANKERIKLGFRTPKRFQLTHQLLKKYSTKFFVKVEQVSLQGDHLHLCVRASRRSNYQSFFRVLPGQISQQFEKAGLLTAPPVTDTPTKTKPKGLWRYRPFTRVVRGYKAYQTLRNYIQLNEKEARREIPYRAQRLKGLSNREWEILWS